MREVDEHVRIIGEGVSDSPYVQTSVAKTHRKTWSKESSLD